jgi:hypothetical protein
LYSALKDQMCGPSRSFCVIFHFLPNCYIWYFNFSDLLYSIYSCTGSYKIDCRPIDGRRIRKDRGASGPHGRPARGPAAAGCRPRCATAALYVPGTAQFIFPYRFRLNFALVS